MPDLPGSVFPAVLHPDLRRPAPGLNDRIASLWRAFPGKTGIAVQRIDGEWAIAQRGTDLFPQQSVSKLWVAMSILDVGLVYGVKVDEEAVQVEVTMTSAACPVTDVILDDIESQLTRVLPPQLAVHVDLVWEPEWTPERMSDSAKLFMGW